MANAFTQTEYTKTYTSFSGSDIKATFGNRVIGELQSITYSVTREKSPIFTLGDPNPRSFSRGKRGIAGSLTFTVFDRDAFTDIKANSSVYRSKFNSSADVTGKKVVSVDRDYQTAMDENIRVWTEAKRPHYSDEIPPFDITITFLNEYGKASQLSIYGVEILNEGMGMSVDDITTEKACTFVARGLSDMGAYDHNKPPRG